ncbi:ADP-ribosylglycohydrolase family protein [Actinocrispum sp. NPDC049592]|uniref:ADP-ribosylglycohydrolase family protein n=1 Tax=Actinocrispum sp. NPDC049592 TaxID=3154835 RepID=UPI003437C704
MFDSLEGLSVGDALGAQFFVPGRSLAALPPGPWEWTDDTEMACNLVAELRDHGEIDQDRLARTFATRFEPYRGYGAGAVVTLGQIRRGRLWRDVSSAAFDGTGSCGNGAAMRVAPLGAHFAGDPGKIAAQATLSAEVTHMHPEGIAGAVAVALAAGIAAESHPTPHDFITEVLDHLPPSKTRTLIAQARTLLGKSAEEAAYTLGNGSQVLAQDTVPFTLWVAATHLTDYPTAIRTCIAAGGDIDTTSAIVGGIIAAHTGADGIPTPWRTAREPLPTW